MSHAGASWDVVVTSRRAGASRASRSRPTCLRSRRPSTGPSPLLSHLHDAGPSGAAPPLAAQIHRRRPPSGCQPPHSPPTLTRLLGPADTVVGASSLATAATTPLFWHVSLPRPFLWQASSPLLRPTRAWLPLRRRRTMHESLCRRPRASRHTLVQAGIGTSASRLQVNRRREPGQPPPHRPHQCRPAHTLYNTPRSRNGDTTHDETEVEAEDRSRRVEIPS